MRRLIAALPAAALCASVAFAQEKPAAEKKTTTAQQTRVEECAKQASAKGLQGRERSQFVSTCLRAEQPPAKPK